MSKKVMLMGWYRDEYLNSYSWKWKREKRIQIDQKCKICGRPFGLEVHHLTYANIPNENMSDLITVCRNCHIKIEAQKQSPENDSFIVLRNILIKRFIKENEHNDYSQQGNIDYCDLKVIKNALFPYLIEHGLSPDYASGSSQVQEYFRDRRYEAILRYMSNGAEPYIVLTQTHFSKNMVYKVFNNPEKARQILNKEDRT